MSALTSIAMKSYQPPSSDELKRINSRVISLLQHLSRPNHDENMNVSNENGHTRASQPLYSSRLADKIDEFTQKSLQVLSFAARYDCGLVQSNGFFSFAKLSIRFLQMIENNLQTISSNGQLPYMENVFVRTIDSFLLMAKYMSDQHESIDVDGKANNNHTDRDADQNKTIQFDSQLFVFRTIKMDVDANANQSIKLPLFSVQLSQFQEMIRTASAFQAPQVSLLNHFGVFWLDQSMNNFFNLYSFLIPFYKLNLIDSVRCLWDRKFRLNKYIEFVRHPTFEVPFGVWNLTESVFYRRIFISLLYFRVNVRSRTLFIPRQTKLFISQAGLADTQSEACCSSRRNHNQVRCRLTLPTSADRTLDQLLLHFHGGGFVSHSPDSHELYIRDWSSRTQTPVLSIDYSLCKAFPTALQEGFDVYYWLRTADPLDVQRKLGFHPKQIVLVGDSAGANLSLSLTVFAHHLLTQHKSRVPDSFCLPDGLFAIYGAFLLVPFLSGSRILSAIDTLINPEILLFLMGVYGGVIRRPKRRSWAETLNPFSSTATNKTNTEPECFLDKDYKMHLDMDKVIETTSSPFVSPILYQHLDQITQVPLHLVSTEFCPFLDESLTIAKFWKGSLKLDVLENLNHGFLNFNILSRRAQDGVDLCSERIQQMLIDIRTKQTHLNKLS